MNICILSTRYPYKDNMVHVFVKKLVDEWAKSGNQCVVISPISQTKVWLGKEGNMPYHEKQEISNGIFVDVYRPRYFHLPNLKFHGVTLTNMSYQKAVDDTISMTGLKYDLIYGHFFAIASKGWKYAQKHNIPLFAATGESGITLPPKPCKEFTIEKFKDDLCGVVAVSTKNKVEAASMGIINPAKAKVFPNGANLDLFTKLDKTDCRKKLGLPQDAFIVLCVGQFIERKGQHRILAAVDRLQIPGIKTVFLGKGEDDFDHSSILYKGTAQNTELPLFLNAADVFVLPTRKEGCCNAIVEALACGVPIVSSDRDFNHDVLNHNNSILVDPDDVDQIAEGINTIYSNKEYAANLANEAYTMGQSLSVTRRALNILAFVKEQIKKQNE